MGSHQIETALLILAAIIFCAVAVTLHAFMVVCQMSLDLQERVAVHGTPIVTRVKFSKCRCKYLCKDRLIQLVGKTFEVVAYQPHWIHDGRKG